MRIVCQKCSAAYAIDDKFVTPKGVRAQCPRCRHLQLVKRESEQATPAAVGAPGGSPFLFEIGSAGTPAVPPPPSQPKITETSEARPRTSAPPSVPPVSAPVPSASAPFAFDFAPAPTATYGGGLQPGGTPPPLAPFQTSPFDLNGLAPKASDTSNPFGVDLPPPPPPAPVKLSGPAPAAASTFDFNAATATAADVRCKMCGKVLIDAFDQALGTCDDCRSKPDESRAEANPRHERVDVSRPAPRAQTFLPVTTVPISNEVIPPDATVRSAFRDGEVPSNRGRMIGIAAASVLVVLLAVFLVIRRPWERKRPPPVIHQAPVLSKPVEVVVQSWRMNYPELEGASRKQAEGFIAIGEKALALDTPRGYLDAEEAFQKALVVDSSNERAVAGWVFSLAFGHGDQIDDRIATAAEAMLGAAEQRSGAPRLYVAHAHLLIARNGNANDVQVMAQRGKGSPNFTDQALAALAVGQAMLGKNDTVAGEAFAESLKLDPKLKRSYFFQARLAAAMGRYRDAIGNLEKRLELDADQWEAADELARLYVEVGEFAKAREVLETALKAAPRNAKARIALAKLGYQHSGEVSFAIDTLNAVIADKEMSNADLGDAYSHLAAAHRVAGDLTRSSEAVEKALEVTPHSVPAKLQRFWVMIEKNVTSQARIDLDSIKGKLGDIQLENELEGRLLFAQGRFDEAAAVLLKVHEAEPRRAEALLLAGAAAARAKRDGKAWEYCLNRGLKLDPLSFAIPAMTQWYVRPADFLKAAVGAYTSLNPTGVEDPNPELCEGLTSWFSEDLATADRHFAKVITIDQKNGDSYAYRALVALKRKDVGSAMRFAGKAVDASRLNALAHYALAASLMAANKHDAAKLEAANAQKLGAGLLAPRVIMGELEARLKNHDVAVRLLTGVLLADSYYRDAKRVLYKQSL